MQFLAVASAWSASAGPAATRAKLRANRARFMEESSVVGLQSLNGIVVMAVDGVRHATVKHRWGGRSFRMLFLGVGIVLLALKYLEITAVADWSWWVVLAPFGL